ncbi:hypothetical protein PYCC9005_004081 [Savitreella phatthalungensis]
MAPSLEQVTKGLRTADLPISQRLKSVNAAKFPRREEFVARYLLEILPEAKPDELDHIWTGLLSSFCALDGTTQLSLLRRSKLIEGITVTFHALSELSSDAATKTSTTAITVLQAIVRHRPLKKAVFTSLDPLPDVLAALTDFLNVRETAAARRFANLAVDLCLYACSYRSTSRKVAELLARHLPRFASDKGAVSGPISRFLQATLFSPDILEEACAGSQPSQNTKQLDLYTLLKDHAGHMAISNLSRVCFEAANNLDLSVTKTIQVWHSLLLTWTQLATGVDKLHVLIQLAATVGSVSSSRFLTPGNNERVREAEIELVEILVNCHDENLKLQASRALLLLDPDVLLPSQVDFLVRLAQSLAGNHDQVDIELFEVELARAHISIRALPDFLRAFGMAHPVRSTPNLLLHRLLSSELAKATEATRTDALRQLIDCATLGPEKRLAYELLSPAISSFSYGSAKLESFGSALAQVCADVVPGTPAAQAASRLELIYNSLVQAPHRPWTATKKTQASSAHLQALLRLAELGQTLEKLEMTKVLREAEHDIFFCKTLIERFLPVIVPLMSDSQKPSFISTCIEHDLQASPALLECDALFMPLQDALVASAQSGGLETLINVPAEWYHKAMRHRIVSSLLAISQERRDDQALIARLLLRFARAGIFAKTEGADIHEWLISLWMRLVEPSSSKLTHALLDAYLNYLLPVDDQIFQLACAEDAPIAMQRMLLPKLPAEYRERQSWSSICDRFLTAANTQSIESSDTLETLNTIVQLDPVGTRSKLESSDLLGGLLDKLANTLDRAHTETGIELQAARLLGMLALDDREALQTISLVEAKSLSDDTLSFFAHGVVSTMSRETREVLVGSWPSTPSDTWLHLATALSTIEMESTRYLLPCFVGTCNQIDMAPITRQWRQQHAFLHVMLDRHHRVLRQSHVDDVCVAVGSILAAITDASPQEALLLDAATSEELEAVYLSTCQLLRAVFEHLGLFLRNRLHIVIHLFCRLASALLSRSFKIELSKEVWPSRKSADQLSRLWSTFVTSGRRATASSSSSSSSSSAPVAATDKKAAVTLASAFDRALAKHLPPLFIEFVYLTYDAGRVLAPVKSSLAHFDAMEGLEYTDALQRKAMNDANRPATIEALRVAREVTREGVLWSALAISSQHERDTTAAALDTSRRAMWRRMLEDWERLGKWREL